VNQPPSAGPIVQLFHHCASGSYSPARLQALADALRGGGARVISAESGNSPPAIDPRATHVCVAGGDGTVRHVFMALARSGRSIPAAIFPSGTINLLARETGYPADPARFARRLLGGGAAQSHYPVTINDTRFFACASAGPDSYAIARLSAPLKRRIGRAAYVVALLGLLRHWPRPRMVLTMDGRSHACEAVYIAKGRYFAGPWSLAPAARLTDKVLHVVALEQARRRDFLRFAWALLRGQDPARLPGVIALQGRKLTLERSEGSGTAAVPVQGDGDIIASLPARVELTGETVTLC
jgi:diacylglycerol kinase family enzyme